MNGSIWTNGSTGTNRRVAIDAALTTSGVPALRRQPAIDLFVGGARRGAFLHCDHFHGREREIAELIGRLRPASGRSRV